jgi:hypothetical protein
LSTREAKRLKVIEDEIKRLKKLVAEKELEIQALDEILSQTLLLMPSRKRNSTVSPRGLVR